MLRDTPVNMVLLIGLLVVIGLLAAGGSLLWKQANRLDPASRRDTVRFFVQNQLGAIITVIAFLPLIVLILTNKDMSGKEKALAGGIGVLVMIAATAVGVDLDAPSVEQYTEESNQSPTSRAPTSSTGPSPARSSTCASRSPRSTRSRRTTPSTPAPSPRRTPPARSGSRSGSSRSASSAASTPRPWRTRQPRRRSDRQRLLPRFLNFHSLEWIFSDRTCEAVRRLRHPVERGMATVAVELPQMIWRPVVAAGPTAYLV
ncbi:hypothetical protein [Nocardioides sp. B-3]|uniref:hypothetical protein n=1 Tax=Nocardioides sp. B-3 TaxID=2895565 RepID=UPI002152F7DF|nr:hypothetical protein [Nocardioides sp. B-3]UUZ61149.1 hypothetical protein LP418_11300 [Nocardioides sp. B-3]